MRNCLGMEDFIREPVPPARITMPVFPKPVNSLLSLLKLVDARSDDERIIVGTAGDDDVDGVLLRERLP